MRNIIITLIIFGAFYLCFAKIADEANMHKQSELRDSIEMYQKCCKQCNTERLRKNRKFTNND